MNDDEGLDLAKRTGTDPRSWFKSAASLRRAAEILWAEIEPGLHPANMDPEQRWARESARRLKSYPALLLLMGLALENAIKGATLRADPSRTGPTGLPDWGRHGHDLEWLFGDAGFSLTDLERDLVRRLGRAVVWSGRYPVPMPKRLSNFTERRGIGADYPIMAVGSPLLVGDFASFDSLFTRIVDSGSTAE